MSLLAAQHPISNAERVPKNGHVGRNLKVDPGRNGLVWAMAGFKIKREASHTFLMLLRKVMNYLSGNGCLSL